MNISKKDKILYGYYLTHIILYDLKFSHQSFNKLSNKKNTKFAIKELTKLRFNQTPSIKSSGSILDLIENL